MPGKLHRRTAGQAYQLISGDPTRESSRLLLTIDCQTTCKPESENAKFPRMSFKTEGFLIFSPSPGFSDEICTFDRPAAGSNAPSPFARAPPTLHRFSDAPIGASSFFLERFFKEKKQKIRSAIAHTFSKTMGCCFAVLPILFLCLS